MDDCIESLISEVEKRPPIYDKSLKEYSDVNIKKKLWEEICAVVVPDWSMLQGDSKTKAGMDIQKKWQGLRNSFARELRIQKQSKSGDGAKKRRKYIYFDNLLFLLSSVENRDTSGNVDNNQSGSGTDSDEPESPIRSTVRQHANRKQPPPMSAFEQSLITVLDSKKNKTVDTDEDVNFALSLVPQLRSLDGYQKMEAKIEILNVLKNLMWPGSSSYAKFNQHHSLIHPNGSSPSFPQNLSNVPFDQHLPNPMVRPSVPSHPQNTAEPSPYSLSAHPPGPKRTPHVSHYPSFPSTMYHHQLFAQNTSYQSPMVEQVNQNLKINSFPHDVTASLRNASGNSQPNISCQKNLKRKLHNEARSHASSQSDDFSQQSDVDAQSESVSSVGCDEQYSELLN